MKQTTQAPTTEAEPKKPEAPGPRRRTAQPPPPGTDTSLWFMHESCRGRHFILGNAHTVPGRLLAWCPKEQCSLFVSKGDMGSMSKASAHWLTGFLHGAEPDPPAGADGPPDFESKAYARWLADTVAFRESGQWPLKRRRP